MNIKEQYIFVRDMIKNNEPILCENRRQFLDFLSKVEALIFKQDTKRSAFDIHRWLKNAIPDRGANLRRCMYYINIDQDNSVATRSTVLNVYNGRFNDLANGLYSPITLEREKEDVGEYPPYKNCFPEKYHASFTFAIADYSGGKDDILEFRNDGIIYNSKLNKPVGTHTKEPTKNTLMISLGLLSIAVDKQKKEFTAELGEDLNSKDITVVKITGMHENCCSLVMSHRR